MKRFGLAASEEKLFENVDDDDGRRTDAGCLPILQLQRRILCQRKRNTNETKTKHKRTVNQTKTPNNGFI